MNQYLFYKVKPICDEIRKNPTVENAKKLSDELSTGHCNEYLCTSRDDIILLAILQQIPELAVRNKNEIKVHLIDAIAKLMAYLKIKSVMSLKTVLIILLKEIYDPSGGCTSGGGATIRPHLSEELKLSVVNAIDILFQSAETNVIEEFYVKENRMLMAQTLSVCVDLIDKDTYRTLRMKAIECIQSVLQIHDNADTSDIVLRHQIADIVFILLPKIVATLKNIATGDEKQGHALISLAIKALGRILWLILADDTENEIVPSVQDIRALVDKNPNTGSAIQTDSDVLSLGSKNAQPTDKLKQIEQKERSREWLHAASRKLKPIIDSMHKLTGSKNDKIRAELTSMVNNLLIYCPRNMSACVPALLELKIALDENTPSKVRFHYSDNLIDTIETIFIGHLIKLPRIIYTGDEDEQHANFLLLKGLIRALHITNRLKIILSNENTLRNLITALTTIVELEKSTNLLEENYSLRLVPDTLVDAHIVSIQNPTPWKEFKNIRNRKLETIIGDICKLLAQNSDVRNLVLDNLLAAFGMNVERYNEILVLFQYFIGDTDKLGPVIDLAILEELLNEIRWNLAVEANTASSSLQHEYSGPSQWYADRTEGLYESAISIRTTDFNVQADSTKIVNADDAITLNDVKMNILHICLVLETVGLYAAALKEKFQTFLLKSLHRILERAGSSHYMIHSAGLFALNKLTAAFNLNSIPQLIYSNADYISYHINVTLKRAEHSKYALDILNVVLQYSSLESMPHLENIVSTILVESAKGHQINNMTSFLRVFNVLLTAIRKWMLPTTEDTNIVKASDTKFTEKRVVAMCEQWLALYIEDPLDAANEEETEATDVDIPESMEDLDGDEEVAVEKPTPLHINLTLKIMERCTRYLASKKQEDKIIALEAIPIGLDIIKDRENDLLPMVHKIWSPFVERIKDENPIVLRRCFYLLQILAKYAKDFIYHRSVKEVLPFIVKFFQHNSKKCPSRYDGFAYEQTQEFRLLHELLLGLPDILTCLDIQEKDLDTILNSTIWLLANNQQKTLQSNCIRFFLNIARFDAPAIYLKLLKYRTDEKYKMNVEKIYAEIECRKI